MFRTRTLRHDAGLMAAATILVLLAILLSGCSDGESSPTATTLPEPPVLPVAEQFTFDFSYFDAAAGLDKAAGQHDNFLNAYLRAVVLDAMAKLTLAAPVSAFGAALHTTPVALADGAWLWTYYWANGPHDLRIELRGRPHGSVVDWELSLAPANGTAVVWFTGSTGDDGREAAWTFRDLDQPGSPVSGRIRWGATANGRFLEFTSYEQDSNGDELRFESGSDESQISFTPGDGSAAGFIRWDASGAGSLMVPDYNGGQEACWDVWLRDSDCQ